MKIQGKKIIVTGGAGFIGSHLVDTLVKKGGIVTVIDNLKNGNIDNLSQSIDKITFKDIDIRDEKAIASALKDQDIIFHLAANADVPYSVKHPDYDFSVNIQGGYNVLKYALEYKVEKFIFASSAAVYGEILYTPIDEKHPTNPISPYGASKLAIERLGSSYYKTYGFPFVAVRIFNTYGPRQRHYVMYDLLKKLYKDSTQLEVLGTGNQVRDYSYVLDTVEAFILAAENDQSSGEVFNIAGGRAISIKQVAEMLVSTLNIKDINIIYTQKSWEGDINTLIADISKIKNIGFSPNTSLEKGVEELGNWLKNNENNK